MRLRADQLTDRSRVVQPRPPNPTTVNPKGSPLVADSDSETHVGEPPSETGRRSLLRAGLGIGALGVLFGAGGASTALATPPPGDPEDPSEQLAVMGAMLAAELATRDLYQAALEAGADALVAEAMALQHRAYADAISGATGLSANRPSGALFDEWSARLVTSDTAAMASAAAELESSLVATYQELVGVLDDGNWVRVISSIAMMEARHGVVLATVAGDADDLASTLDPDAAPLNVEELS